MADNHDVTASVDASADAADATSRDSLGGQPTADTPPRPPDAHLVRFRGRIGSIGTPFTAYCETCSWVCGGHPDRVREAAKLHGR